MPALMVQGTGFYGGGVPVGLSQEWRASALVLRSCCRPAGRWPDPGAMALGFHAGGLARPLSGGPGFLAAGFHTRGSGLSLEKSPL